MELHGRRRGRISWIPEQGLYFRNDGSDFRLGFDPKGENWTVELNQPGKGSENPLSGLARDASGGRYLLRQGTLHPNALSPRIESDQFGQRTGLQRANLTVHGEPAKRFWFIVTALELQAEEICRNTAIFVDRCALARSADGWMVARRDEEGLTELLGKPEQGGRIIGRPIMHPNERRRWQGEVWQRLQAVLTAKGRKLDKPRHARGYEVDGEIKAPSERLLVEIKTDSTAADVYAGIGQLMVYPKLLPRLSGHRRILLLPAAPSAALVEAIRECGVELCSYELTINGDDVNVIFSDHFLRLCGIDS